MLHQKMQHQHIGVFEDSPVSMYSRFSALHSEAGRDSFFSRSVINLLAFSKVFFKSSSEVSYNLQSEAIRSTLSLFLTVQTSHRKVTGRTFLKTEKEEKA